MLLICDIHPTGLNTQKIILHCLA